MSESVSSAEGPNNNDNVQHNAFAHQNAGNVRPRHNNEAEYNHRAQRYRTHNGHEITTEPAQADNPSHKVPVNYSVVTVGDMMQENAISMRKVLYLKLLRIVAQTKKGESFAVSSKKSTKTDLGNHRLFLCMDIFSKQGQTVYMINNNVSENRHFWSKALSLRDNGQFTIGTIFAVLAPKRITEKYNNDVPIVHTNGGIVVMNDTNTLPRIELDTNLPERVTRAFHMNATITILNVSVEDTKCTGFFCDRQRIRELNRGLKGCGCFTTTTRLSNMVISFDMMIHGHSSFEQMEFTSHRFTNIFLTQPFPDGVSWRDFDHNDNLDSLMNSVESIVHYVNGKGGWLVTGWSKRGEVNDATLVNTTADGSKKVASSEIRHHVTTVEIADASQIDQLTLNQKKFDMDNVMN